MTRLSVVAAALSGLLCACSDDVSSRFFILQNQVPTAGCKISASRSDVYQGEGRLDVSLVSPGSTFAYELFPLIQNSFPSAGGMSANEPNRLFVRAFRVRVEAGDGAPQKVYDFFNKLAQSDQTSGFLEFQQPWAGTIEPGGGLLAAAVGVIPGEVARQLRATRALDTTSVPLLVHLKAVGKRQDGEVESGEFTYPIQACDGCLGVNLGSCPATPVNMGNACNIAQDATVDCCTRGVELTCPARPAEKPAL
jgi:hypothetical protein